ncbi:MAG: hypothetical protein IJ192_06960 [Clostridia bacterium]|nr:hypothetical protein [Clostridia bacterium]
MTEELQKGDSMAISGVGSIYNYNYNLQTKRLSSSNGAKDDEFVRYYNDELKGEESDSLNGYDRRTKAFMHRSFDIIQHFYDAGLMDKPVADPSETEVEVSCRVEDSITTGLYINGDKRLTLVSNMVYLPDEIKSFGTVAPPFKTTEHKDYNPIDNSIHIAVGDKFSYGNGYTLTVGETKVMGAGYDGKSDAENQAADRFLGALNSLLHFADQQYFSSMIEKEMTPQILKFLQEQGVDTGKEFIINDTRCEVIDGRIREAEGNKEGIPNSIYNKALARYEESLNMLLKNEGTM